MRTKGIRLLPAALCSLFIASTLVPSPARAEKPIKLGFVYIMSGPFATYGQFAKQGAEMAIDEVNGKGGILGRKVEAVFEDSTGKADVGIRVVRKLVYDEGVDAVIGLDSSGVAEAVTPVMPELKTPLIITHAASPHVTGSKCNRYTFRVSLDMEQNVMMGATIGAEGKAKKWTTVGPDYAFGHDSWTVFQKYLREKKPGVTFLPDDQVAFPTTKTTDLSPYITKVMNSDPEGVFISLWGGNLIDFVKQAGEMGFFKKNYEVLMSLGAATEVLTALGDKMPIGIWVGTRYWFLANDSKINKAFVDGYKKRFGVYPSYNAHGAYGAVMAYKAAAEKGKSTDKEAIVDALEGLSLELPVGRITIRPGDHQAVTDGAWGRTAADRKYPIRILKPIRNFRGEEITPPVSETGCKMK